MSTTTEINSLIQAVQSSGALYSLHANVDSGAVLVTIMPDDSGSIRFAGNAQVVRDGHNLVLDALQYSYQRDSILAHPQFLNSYVLSPYRGSVRQCSGDLGAS